MPVTQQRPNSGLARDLAPGTLLSKDYRARTAIALTRDRIVITQAAAPGKPAHLVLLSRDGSELASVIQPADPLTNLAITGNSILVPWMAAFTGARRAIDPGRASPAVWRQGERQPLDCVATSSRNQGPPLLAMTCWIELQPR